MSNWTTITDWSDAYANRAYVPDADDFINQWADKAQAFRDQMRALGRVKEGISYGAHDREKLDLFLPEGEVRGLFVFVHGGYWMAFDQSYWSHLANGMISHGWAVAIPGYVLAPEARITDMTRQVATAISIAAQEIPHVPISIAGHSAGGHLVSRMACNDTPLSGDAAKRLSLVVSISGLHDLRALMKTDMNDTLGIDMPEALAESAALLQPRDSVAVHCYVGADERPEFLRQNKVLASIWSGLGVPCKVTEEPGLHHFSVIESLALPDGALVQAALDLP